jgi:circadian clock protein KaiB
MAAAERAGRPIMLELRLYVAGDAPNSLLARDNLRTLLSGLPPDVVTLEIIDCLREPQRALRDGVLVTPTLVRMTPAPRRTIVGTLSDAARVAAALGLADLASAVAPTPTGLADVAR